MQPIPASLMVRTDLTVLEYTVTFAKDSKKSTGIHPWIILTWNIG